MPKEKKVKLKLLEKQFKILARQRDSALENKDYSECAFIIYEQSVVTDRILAIKVR